MTTELPISPRRLAELMGDIRPEGDEFSRRPKPGCVEGVINNAVQAAQYHQDSDEPDVLHVAAFLLRSLAQNHCYEDGNKRIAWVAMLDVLWTGASLTVDVDEIEAADMVNHVATGKWDIGHIIRWLADRLVPAD